jgi:hypothetical protein
MTGDWSVDVPTYDAVFAAFARQWPQLPEDLRVCMFSHLAHFALLGFR